MNKVRLSVNAMKWANETSGLQGGVMVKTMAIPYKTDKALCSPTSALEKKTSEC
jgi:hypothetical protein